MRAILLTAIFILAACAALRSDSDSAKPRQVLAPSEPSKLKAPDGSPAVEGGFSSAVPASSFGARGTAALWFRTSSTMRSEKGPDLPLLSGDLLCARIAPRGDSVCILTDFGRKMTGADKDGNRKPYSFQSLLTHLKGGRWYHAAWTWDAGVVARTNFYLDGIAQDGPGLYAYPGQLSSAMGASGLQVGSDGLTVSALTVYSDPLTETQLKAVCKAAGHRGYTDEGVRFTGEKFVPEDVDWAHPVYETSFDDPSVLKDWRLEGGYRMRVDRGSFVLENAPQGRGTNLVCWLDREAPADFLLEFTIRPHDRREGLAIVFFNARGLHGESIFDPALSPRNGAFEQYHSGEMNCYHISYWAGGRGTANVRKNRGFHLVSVGSDLVTPGKPDAFQTIRVYKREGRIRLMVDDVVAVTYDDDGKTYGPVWKHTGRIGLRQMGHAQSCEYGHLRIYPLK